LNSEKLLSTWNSTTSDRVWLLGDLVTAESV